ncbi:myosin Ie, putative [Pediculus humanus corporis]|uniref:Myosin Ie, putative n=1 Tax=Pediculus humanus subsp. corporis TaxID=121224 RepID=E0VIC8_PEDHC|nr:myosin Ie, putative [Pediculus humanus corporis]EEB13134.1 myosin Ie, putative [Pediculus humanus corporis]
MVLLSKITEEAIVDNLRKRYMDDYIFTCIGSVLISVNPFKQMPYFTDKEIETYQGAAPYENPPHIYGLADEMFRNMIIDRENQCVIISGESGAGKTVAAKYIMSFITKVSGGGLKVQHVKNVVLKSNPLLEAFGNAKTVRNNNSSRFGKYVEMLFDVRGEPIGGKISNFLLEKSRDLGILNPEYFNYLTFGGNYLVEGTNDAKNFKETLEAMNVMGLSKKKQFSILKIVSSVLHLGNINFSKNGNYAVVENEKFLTYPAYLLDVKVEELKSKLISRKFDGKWGSQSDTVNVTLNIEQACYTRDALAKAIYSKLFDYLVNVVNDAMATKANTYNVGILDIYGFEIFDKNGFEQFCINFVNEKLQQIFIELTLKSEQEEYAAEKIEWTPIHYFNNKIVCELIEGKKPPGIFCILDDVCATLHAVSSGADLDFQKKLNKAVRQHDHYVEGNDSFIIHHYAGKVSYDVHGFCDKNRDVLFSDLVELMQSSESKLLCRLFQHEDRSSGSSSNRRKSRPTTAGNKIRTQANALVEKLKNCRPHYVRCIKPNETKKSKEWLESSVRHQVEYLGLKENIRVRRAGFAYRRLFQKFLFRYGILTKETKNGRFWRGGDDKSGVEWIMKKLNIPLGSYQLGMTKVFIKAPETLFMLEEMREKKYNDYARIIQKAFKKHFARRQRDKEKLEASNLVVGKKQRRKNSLNRNFVGDYVGVGHVPSLVTLIGRKEKIVFAQTVKKYDRNFKTNQRCLILTETTLFLIETRDKTCRETIKRKIDLEKIDGVTLSTLKDDLIVIRVRESYDSLLEITFKTEFLYCLSKKYESRVGSPLTITFSNKFEFKIKKEDWGGGGGMRFVNFIQSESDNLGELEIFKSSGKVLNVTVSRGLPNTSGTRAFPEKSNVASSHKKNSTTKNIQVFKGSAAPPPPSDPVPPNQPVISSFKFNYQRFNEGKSKEIIPNGLLAHVTNTNTVTNDNILKSKMEKPIPGGGKPRPPLKPKPVMLSRCKAVYDYVAQDLDELSLTYGDIITIVKEHEGGWWQGRLKGKEGLFPSNYVEKM